MSWQQKVQILHSKIGFLHPKVGQFEHLLENPGSGAFIYLNLRKIMHLTHLDDIKCTNLILLFSFYKN